MLSSNRSSARRIELRIERGVRITHSRAMMPSAAQHMQQQQQQQDVQLQAAMGALADVQPVASVGSSDNIYVSGTGMNSRDSVAGQR